MSMQNEPKDQTIWRPYTQMLTAKAPLRVASTAGSRITLEDGRELIDGVASWWTAAHGYNHPHILAAVARQLNIMPHIMFGGMVHEPARRLAERLRALAPGDIDHIFFVDSGSVSVDVAMKMAVQYAINIGQTGKMKFLHFRDGYHGDTMACMSVCDPEESMHSRFKEWLPQQILAELPIDETKTDLLDRLMAANAQSIAAVIIEPLVQGVGGMKFHEPSCLRRVSELCAKYGLLLIADEIFTGFGRTGTMFACEQAGIVPDILCLGKALSGGVITLAATMARGHVFQAFLSPHAGDALMHGPTFMANPLACAAANASLDLFEAEPRLEQVKAIEGQLRKELEPCRSNALVEDVRVKGAIGVVELTEVRDAEGLRDQFIQENVWIRVYGNIIYLTPALNIAPTDLTRLTLAINDVLAGQVRKAA